MVEPVLKWAGGKRGLLHNIRANFPHDYKKRRYHEPFIGGGAVFFWLKPKKGSINDINRRLMNFYKILRDKPEKLIQTTKIFPYQEEVYYKLRDRFNHKKITDVEEAALLLYFNKTAFNGLYRENSKGEFNVPFGSYINPTIVQEERIRSASKVLKGIDIYNEDFSYILKIAERGDLCYFDPPYQPVSVTADFTSYTKEGFDFNEQKRLRDICLQMHKTGVLFILSNSYAEPIRRLYEKIDEFRVEKVSTRRVISSNVNTRGPISEILVSNIPKETTVNARASGIFYP